MAKEKKQQGKKTSKLESARARDEQAKHKLLEELETLESDVEELLGCEVNTMAATIRRIEKQLVVVQKARSKWSDANTALDECGVCQ